MLDNTYMLTVNKIGSCLKKKKYVSPLDIP